MNAAITAALTAGRSSMRPPSKRTGAMGLALSALVFLGLLWIVLRLYVAGDPLVEIGRAHV